MYGDAEIEGREKQKIRAWHPSSRCHALIVCVIDISLFRDMLAVDAAMDPGGLVRQAEDLG